MVHSHCVGNGRLLQCGFSRARRNVPVSLIIAHGDEAYFLRYSTSDDISSPEWQQA